MGPGTGTGEAAGCSWLLRHDGCGGVVILTSLLAGVCVVVVVMGRGDMDVLRFLEIEEIGEEM